MNDNLSLIRRVSELIKYVGFQEAIDYSATHVARAFLVWRPPHGAAAIYKAPGVCGVRRFKIAIWVFVDVSDRGHTLLHELLHIPFDFAGLPKQADLTKSDHRFLEDSIDELATEAISENPTLPVQMWESLFGFPIDKFTR